MQTRIPRRHHGITTFSSNFPPLSDDGCESGRGEREHLLTSLFSLSSLSPRSFLVLRPPTQNPRSHDNASLTVSPLGRQQVFDLTEPVTSSFIANGITVHNCSEYMFLDDTACNLASLNVLRFFDAESKTFDIESYRHGIRLWTVVLEISVLMASFPSEEIATRSYKFRTLGLGYANLGAMLMQAGIAYDSSKGRAICAALTSILTGARWQAARSCIVS